MSTLRKTLTTGLQLTFVAVFAALCWSLASVHATESTRVMMQLHNGTSAITTTGTTVGSPFVSQCRESAIYVEWGVGTTAGVVTIESASSAAYTGTWAPLGTVTWSAASKADIIQITGVHLALRARISTGVTGGTINAWFTCN